MRSIKLNFLNTHIKIVYYLCLGITLTRFSYNKTFNVEGKAVYRFYMRNSGYRNVAHAYAVVFRDGREREHALNVEKMALPSLTVAPPTCAPPVMRQSAFLSNNLFNKINVYWNK